MPSRARRTDQDLAQVEFLAWLLDNSIPVPGTGGRRIGLDAIIGFVPLVGDMLAGGLGLIVVARAAQIGVPRVVLARMLFNVAVDFVVGSIPVAGDAFDLWFKASSRNLYLMRRYVGDRGASTRPQWLFFGALVLVAILAAAAVVWLIAAVIAFLAGTQGA